MDYQGLSVQGSVLLLLRHGYEIENTLTASADTPGFVQALLVLRAAAEASLHSLLLLAVIIQRRLLITFWLYYGYRLALLQFSMTFWMMHLGMGPACRTLLEATLLWSVWHSAYQYLVLEHDRDRGAGRPGDEAAPNVPIVPGRADRAAPNAPSWEQDLDSPFGWQRMAETNQFLADIFSFVAGILATVLMYGHRRGGAGTE